MGASGIQVEAKRQITHLVRKFGPRHLDELGIDDAVSVGWRCEERAVAIPWRTVIAHISHSTHTLLITGHFSACRLVQERHAHELPANGP